MLSPSRILSSLLRFVVIFLMFTSLSVALHAAPVGALVVTDEEDVQETVEQEPGPIVTEQEQQSSGDDLSIGSKDNQLKEITDPGTAFGYKPKKPPVVKTRRAFSLKQTSFIGAGHRHKGYKWNGCSKTAAVVGGFGPRNRNKCANNSRTAFNTDFASHLQENFMPCSQKAAKKAGLKIPQRVFLSLGTVRENRRKNTPSGHGGWSHHAYGRALDIYAFTLYDSKKRRTLISAHKKDYGGQVRKFYNKFVTCWDQSVRKLCGRKSGTIVHSKADHALTRQGHHFYSNGLHADHIHLEFPHGCSGRRAKKDRQKAKKAKR